VFTKEEAIAMADAFNALKPKIREEGIIGTTGDFIMNLLPPRLSDSLKNFGQSHR
jgi:hypothetical protein